MPESDERPSRPSGRPRDAEVDEALHRAALELFIEQGLDRMTFEQVAKRAGTTRAAIYRRWNRKTDMVVAALGRLRERYEQDFGVWQEMTLAEICARLLDVAPQMLAGDRLLRLQARVIGSLPDHPELMRAYRAAYYEPRRRAFVRILDQAKADGRLSADADVEILMDMYASAMVTRMLLADGSGEADLRAWLERLLRQLGWIG